MIYNVLLFLSNSIIKVSILHVVILEDIRKLESYGGTSGFHMQLVREFPSLAMDFVLPQQENQTRLDQWPLPGAITYSKHASHADN